MADYWQDKRISYTHVACAWGLVLVALAGMVAITYLTAPACSPWQETAAAGCADARLVWDASAQRQP
jgi:hypothetical protein